ncbi:hypothetical protein TWF694_010973 [Orbilia ellipsospora]|uniref:Uncharacterized protein n=1 Tax=Orbilia ellipsospora TaxID=2528407 RepID=A0AAV9X7M6_9PEZI
MIIATWLCTRNMFSMMDPRLKAPALTLSHPQFAFVFVHRCDRLESGHGNRVALVRSNQSTCAAMQQHRPEQRITMHKYVHSRHYTMPPCHHATTVAKVAIQNSGYYSICFEST